MVNSEITQEIEINSTDFITLNTSSSYDYFYIDTRDINRSDYLYFNFTTYNYKLDSEKVYIGHSDVLSSSFLSNNFLAHGKKEGNITNSYYYIFSYLKVNKRNYLILSYRGEKLSENGTLKVKVYFQTYDDLFIDEPEHSQKVPYYPEKKDNGNKLSILSIILIVFAISFVLGLIVGGIIFIRRKKKRMIQSNEINADVSPINYLNNNANNDPLVGQGMNKPKMLNPLNPFNM